MWLFLEAPDEIIFVRQNGWKGFGFEDSKRFGSCERPHCLLCHLVTSMMVSDVVTDHCAFLHIFTHLRLKFHRNSIYSISLNPLFQFALATNFLEGSAFCLWNTNGQNSASQHEPCKDPQQSWNKSSRTMRSAQIFKD